MAKHVIVAPFRAAATPHRSSAPPEKQDLYQFPKRLGLYEESGLVASGRRRPDRCFSDWGEWTTGPAVPTESGLHADFEKWLEKLAPEKPHSQYRHNGAEDNADAHLKRSIMGREVVVAVTDGRLDFGPWEQIFYGEFDGLRRKSVLVKIIGE